MTMTRKILNLLSEGDALTVEQLADKVGIPASQARRVIAEMRVTGYIESTPVTYSITNHGRTRHQFQPKVYVPKRKTAPQKVNVERAIRTVPNSVFALGAMA